MFDETGVAEDMLDFLQEFFEGIFIGTEQSNVNRVIIWALSLQSVCHKVISLNNLSLLAFNYRRFC